MAIQSNFPAIRPSLLLDFANAKRLDPRVTFTRASTATFYDGSTVAKAAENLLLRSQDYSATWVATSLTPVTGKTAPDGTSTATEFTASGANGTLTQSVTAVAGDYTFSVFLRRVTGTGNVDISAHSAGTWVTQTLTADWQRFTVTQTLTAGARTPGIRIVTSTDAIEVWGAQLEFRGAATAYTPTTTQQITNYVPVLRTAAAGVPRFDHNPITGESLGLLIEEQRQNVATYSEDLTNATAWTATRSSVIANTVVAPDGTLTGDKLVEDTTASNTHILTGPQVSVGGSVDSSGYVISFYAKAGERFRLRALDNGQTGAGTGTSVFNLSTGTVVSGTGTMTAVGNGWYRCVLFCARTFGTNARVTFRLDNGSTETYTGDGYSGLYIWGVQYEAQAFPTSYIPTVASAVTRQADAASMTGANFSSWYRDDEGTLLLDAVPVTIASANHTGVLISDRAVSSDVFGVAMGQNVGGPGGQAVMGIWVRQDGANQALLFTANNVATIGTPYRAAGAYKVNDFAMSVNGATAATDMSGIVQRNMDRMFFGPIATVVQHATYIRKFAFYPLRLTNAQLQAITG